MKISGNLLTGPINDVSSNLRRAFGQYLRNPRHNHAKVGISTSPARRWLEEYEGKWDVMYVLYKTASLESAKECEALLIKHSWNSTAKFKLAHNVHPGKNGHFCKRGPYFVYLVLSSRNVE